jgi:drug/metabolite transporter (DMT)-like permease
MSWLAWAVLSALLNGVRAFVGKRTAMEHGDIVAAQVLLPAVMVVVSIPLLLLDRAPLAADFWGFFFAAALQGGLFFFASLTRLQAFQTNTSVHVVLSIIQASTPVIVVLSAMLFEEWASLLNPWRLAGVSLAILATYLLLRLEKSGSFLDEGILLAGVSMVASAGATLAAKYTFIRDEAVSIFGFILIANAVNLVLASIRAAMVPPSGDRPFTLGVTSGVVMGLLNFAGFASFLEAIKDGDLSLVASIGALSIIVPVILASWLYGERLGSRRRIAVLACIVALVLLAIAP